jgi:hypothetical protein
MAPKNRQESNTYIRQSRLQTYIRQPDKKWHFILIKGAIHQKEITVINVYVPNVSTLSFIKHTPKKLKAHIDSTTVIVGDFNTPLSWIDRSSKQKIKEILELNDTINQMDV